jgi:hypothetical protein
MYYDRGRIIMVKNPKSKTAGCDTCLYCAGDIYEDETPDKVKRVYCKARHADVDIDIMNKFCDFFKVKPEE